MEAWIPGLFVDALLLHQGCAWRRGKMIWVPNESQGFEVETFHEALGSKDGNLFLVVFGKLNPQLECLFLLN